MKLQRRKSGFFCKAHYVMRTKFIKYKNNLQPLRNLKIERYISINFDISTLTS